MSNTYGLSRNLYYLVFNTHDLNLTKERVIWIFMGVFCPHCPFRNRNSWNLPYLVCIMYSLNFIKIGGRPI